MNTCPACGHFLIGQDKSACHCGWRDGMKQCRRCLEWVAPEAVEVGHDGRSNTYVVIATREAVSHCPHCGQDWTSPQVLDYSPPPDEAGRQAAIRAGEARG